MIKYMHWRIIHNSGMSCDRGGARRMEAGPDQAKTLRTIVRASIYAISTTVNLPLDSANPEIYLKMVCPHGTGGGLKASTRPDFGVFFWFAGSRRYTSM